MDLLTEHSVQCPYCGEWISVLVDSSEMGQDYIEDCQVCCRPIVFSIQEDERGEIYVNLRTEDDTF